MFSRTVIRGECSQEYFSVSFDETVEVSSDEATEVGSSEDSDIQDQPAEF